MDGDAVVSVPAIKYSLLFVAGYRACLMKWALCVVGFKRCMEVECLEVYSVARLAILLCIHHHAVVPCHRLAYRHWLEDTQSPTGTGSRTPSDTS